MAGQSHVCLDPVVRIARDTEVLPQDPSLREVLSLFLPFSIIHMESW